MTLTKALRLAILALTAQQKPLHVDANLYEHHDADYPLAVSASKQRRVLREAIFLLTEHLEQLKPKGR